MSVASPASVATPADGGPALATRIAAVAVIVALAALAAYTLFSGPTTVTVGGPAKAAPTRSAPAAGERGFEGPEGGQGD
jgi:hypothetical protein